jgi:hypothetical protein
MGRSRSTLSHDIVRKTNEACKSLAFDTITGFTLHNEMVDDASAEDYACPSIFKNDMKMRLPRAVRYSRNLLSFLNASVTTLEHISIRLFSDTSHW